MGDDDMELEQNQSKIKPVFNSNTKGKNATFPNNLVFDVYLPQVNVILVNRGKKNKLNIDPNELLMEFHCEV